MSEIFGKFNPSQALWHFLRKLEKALMNGKFYDYTLFQNILSIIYILFSK